MNAEEIVPALLAACPSAQARWQDHVEWWGEDERGYFNDVVVFAHHVVESYFDHDTTQELQAFFGVLERMLLHGDELVRELATIGLIEDVQNIASHRPDRWHVFEPWLQPHTKEAWKAVERMWEGVPSLMDMVRRERG